MSLPANESRLKETTKRFARMPLSELITEWEERLFESERTLLAKELDARGYRVKSLPLPVDDVPDGDEAAVKEGMEQLEAELAQEEHEQEESDIIGGGSVCYLIAAFTVIAHAVGGSGMDPKAPLSWILPIALAAVFVALGRAIHRGSKVAAFTALALYGLEVFGRVWLALEQDVLGEGGTRIRIGTTTFLFIALFRSAVALSRRGSEGQDPAPKVD